MTSLRDIDHTHSPYLETSDVMISQSNNPLVRNIKPQQVSSNVPISIGRRTVQLGKISYDVSYEDKIVTTNDCEALKPSVQEDVNQNSKVGEDRYEAVMKIIDELTKRMDVMEKKIDVQIQQRTKKNDGHVPCNY